MIEPTSKDIARFVVYVDNAPTPTVQSGRITSFNEKCVFVAFPKRLVREVSVQACDRASLYWLEELLEAPRHLAQLERKVAHGCLEHPCKFCDQEALR